MLSHKGLIHGTLKLSTEPLNTAAAQVNVVGPLRQHRAFNFNNIAETVSDSVFAGRARVRGPRCLDTLDIQEGVMCRSCLFVQWDRQ